MSCSFDIVLVWLVTEEVWDFFHLFVGLREGCAFNAKGDRRVRRGRRMEQNLGVARGRYGEVSFQKPPTRNRRKSKPPPPPSLLYATPNDPHAAAAKHTSNPQAP